MADHSISRGPRLREQRLARMMTQHDVAERLDELAWLLHKRRVGVNPDMVSKWERGEKRPSSFYLKLLCALYDASPADLGFGRPSEPLVAAGITCANPPLQPDILDLIGPGVEVLQASLFALWREDMLNRRQLLIALGLTPAAIGLGQLEVPLGISSPLKPPFRGTETMSALEEMAGRLEAAYHRAQPARLLLPAKALADTAERYLDDEGPGLRRGLLQVVARAQLLAGRLSFFDLHRPMDARAHLDLAREAAIEAQDPLLLSAALGHMAFLPAEHHQLAAASSYLAGARTELTNAAAPQLAGWVDAVESEVRSKAGEHLAARTALERARTKLMSGGPAVPAWFDYFDDARLSGFEGFASRKAGDLDSARMQLEHALDASPIRFPKQRAVTMLDLASVCADQGDVDAGCAIATDAVVALREAGYATAVDRLREFHTALPDTRHPAARLLEEAVVELS